MRSAAKQNRKPDNVLSLHVVDSKQVLCKVSAANSRPTQITKVTSVARLQVVRGDVANLTARVLAHLADVEVHARLGDRDDIRVAWIVVLKASEGHPDPFAIAFWQYFGETPEKLIPFLAARDYANRLPFPDKYLPFRYTQDWQAEFDRILRELALPPKKDVQSVRFPAPRKEAA